MTSTLAQGVGRIPGESVRPLRALAASPALIVLLLGGLALRLTIAYVLFPSSGFETDLASYASWALTLGEHGANGFYANAGFADYPPAYLYLLWPIGLLASQASDPAAMASDLVKLPPILLDLAVGYVIYRLVLGWAWPGRRAEAMALAAAALYVFNPVSFYDSALWGQSDAAGALLVLLGTAALIRGNSEGAAALAAAAALVKPQFGVVLVPLVAFTLIKRHLVRPGSGPRHAPWAPHTLASWLTRHQGPLRLLTAILAAGVAFFALALPFGMGPYEYLERMLGTAGGYAYLSVNAFNVWALVGSGGAPSLAESLSWSDDTVPLLGPIPGVAIGAVLLVGGFLWGAVRGAVRDDRWTLLVAAAFLAVAFFILPTRVHERYIFPAVALLPILAVASGRWAIALLVLSVGAFINLHAILTVPLYGTDNVTGLPLGEWFRTTPLVAASALLQTAVGLWAAWQLRPSLRSSPDAFDEVARPAAPAIGRQAPQPWPAAGPAGTWPGSTGAWTAPDTRALATGDGPPDASRLPPPFMGPGYPAATVHAEDRADPGWARGPGVLDWIVHRLSRPSIRADRSASLAGERGGRLDRYDVLMVIGLVLVAVLVRGYRLEQPVGMYFDEVYHARTATEFLQDWEYGQPHAIYEFTHPHLAKYAMAWGIRLAGGNEVTATGQLGSPVIDAVIERAWSTSDGAAPSAGDRLYVATGSALQVYDLASDALVNELPIAATALAIDEGSHTLYLADPAGGLFRLDTAGLEARPDDQADDGRLEAFSAGPGTPVERLVVTDTSLLAISTGSISTFDTESGAPLSERFSFAASDALALPWEERVVVDTRQLSDRPQTARRLARALDGASQATGSGAAAPSTTEPAPAGEVDRLERLFEAEGFVVADAYLDEEALKRVQEAIDEGGLNGTSIESAPLLAVADHRGISILDAWTLDLIAEVPTEDAVTSLALVTDGLDTPTLYAAAGDRLEIVALLEGGPGLPDTLTMPGAVRRVAWNEPANLVHVLGDAPTGGPTVYVVEPHGNAVFADVPLPAEPSVLLADTQPEHPDRDRGELLAVTADGGLARIGIDDNAFGWRLPGMLMGALMAGLLYLLARVLFARRSVAVLTAILVVAEGMLFANARIGMNDVYVTTFLVTAALLFAPLYLRPRRPWTAIALLAGTGIALGLALASKWVALYAIGGLLLLVLLRSGLGRIMALLGMIALTALLGAMAVRPAPVDDPARNWVFLLMMLMLTGLLAAAMVRRPLPVTKPELRLAIVGPVIIGATLLVVGLLASAAGSGASAEGSGALGEAIGAGSSPALDPAWLLVAGGLAILVGLGAAVIAWLAARVGHGPWAPEVTDGVMAAPTMDGRRAGDPTTSGATAGSWLAPGRRGGLPWLFTLACLTLLPLGVYIVSYAPWVELGNSWGLPLIGSLPFMPQGGDVGQTLAELTSSIYRYHDSLRASHAASSPWWAWPLDLKPVWFFSERYSGSSSGLIYDTGNLVIFWLGMAAMGFASWAAWRRRSLSLTLLVILWAALWLPWARIDRATFQYHIYASLPFAVLALGYFLAELWHGPSPRTWFLA
ncbi:MAG TPA: phospholipid carrier-dependent glycosyltransferase, partial [Candidatus Deferrimicrobium sp.]|nr:phospholipid carrier-dependent glycosyltransferase [Candidatus Deferrimicrobium sp.]